MYVIAILWITLKRMVKNWTVMGGLLGGLVLASGIMAMISIYAAGSLQKSFQNAWQEKDTFRPPFSLILSHSNDRRETAVPYASLQKLEGTMDREIRRRVGQPALSFVQFTSIGNCRFTGSRDEVPTLSSPSMEVDAISNLQDVASIVDGRWYRPRSDGVVEIVVDENTLEKDELLVGQRYEAWYEVRDGETAEGAVDGYVILPVQIVGFFTPRPGFTTKDWIYPPPYLGRVFAHPDVLRGQLLDRQRLRAERFDMLWVFDSARVQVANLDALIAGLGAAEHNAASIAPQTSFWLSPLDFFREFSAKARAVSLFLSALAVPVMGMVLYFIVLMAGLAVDHRKKEIVVMYSRGAGRVQVIASFLLEWLILGAVALAAGPFVGRFLARVMGASAGFLTFVNREAIPAAIGRPAWLFSLAASLLAVAAGMAPVFATVRQTIVTYSRRRERKGRTSLFHRLFLDVIFLALAAVAYRELMWQSTKLAPDETVAADPLLFFVPVLFLLGAGLLLLRIYPLLLAGLRALAGKLPGVVWQLTLRRLTRTAHQYFPLLLLLILTLSLGIYSAATARTLARNFEDAIRYRVGADLAMTEAWQPPNAPAPGPSSAGQPASEPPFLKRLELPGVLSAARVLTGDADATVGDVWSMPISGTMLAMEPEEFVRTAWFRDDFGKGSLRDYLAILSRHPEGMLVSTDFFQEEKLSLGDPVILTYKGQTIETFVAGTVSYWPSLDPLRSPFFILTLEYVQEYTRLEPYQVWYRLKDHDHVQDLVDALPSLGVYPTQVSDAEALIVAQRQEPYRMGFTGILSMGFIVSALVTVLGFIVFTYFSVRGRLMQFGSLRAMGFSGFQLIAHLGLEQVLTLGTGLGIGTGLGLLCSRLFLPFLRDRASEVQRVPPFLIIADKADTLSSLAVLLALFVLAVLTLVLVLARMRLDRALRMGEEQ